VPTAGGINPEEEAFDQGHRHIRLRGRDQETGENFGPENYLPGRSSAEAIKDRARAGDARAGAAALDHPERPRDGFEEISAIAELQRRLNAHYGQ
jgi:hypothetical protein